MDIAQLRCFVAVSRERNIGKAAELIHLTPSPVSRTIRQLEIDLGTALFERRYHELVPTAAADRLLPKAVEIIAQLDDLAHHVHPRPLRIGGTPWAPARYAERARQALTALGEEVGRVEEEMSSVLLPMLRHGELDLAIVHLPVDIPGISVRPLARYRFYALSSSDSELPTTTVHASDLRGHHAITLPLTLQPSPMRALTEQLLAAGVVKVSEIDFADVLTLESRLRRTGELMLCIKADDTPLSQMIARMDLRATPVDIDDIDFELGVAWRSPDALNGDRVRAVVDLMRPPGAELDIV